MSRSCGPVGTKSTTIEVTFPIAIERDGWEQTGYGQVWGTVEREHELRAAVTFHGINDAPEVAWLDQAVVDDIGLTAAELEGAEEQAVEAACDVLRKRGEDYEDPAIARADHELDQRKDDELFARSA